MAAMPVPPASSRPPRETYTAQQLEPLLSGLQGVQSGDFSIRLPVNPNGILSRISQAFNDLVSLNEGMAQEIERVGSIVGREGRMTERAELSGARGQWRVQANAINRLIEDLARPTTEVARVITAVAEGDLTQKMALEIEGTPVKGEFLRIGTTVNTMVDQLSSFADEVTRVAREVGTEGKLGGQADVKGVSGTWKDLTDNVNLLAGNLTDQVRNIAKVTTAVANGDLSQKITVDARGEILELKNTINIMVDQLSSFADEVTRVAREVGTEGILGGQADVKGVSGTWKDLTDNVNGLASNLTNQVRNIALVTTAIANGDLSQKITVDAQGEILELKDTINRMVDQLNTFAGEVTRVAREVGTEGILGGQADVKGVSGTWKDLTDNVNGLAGNLTNQVRNIALVTTAVANGDLSQKITVDVKGEVLELKNTINTMVDQLSSFADEVTRVAREVGTEGKLGGQADVKGVSGTWKDLTDNVNLLAGNLTDQVRNIAKVTTAVANGDLSQKITVDARGEILELKNTINIMVDQLSSFADEVTRVAREVGTEGILGGQAKVPGVSGTWKDLTDNVNFMASNLTTQVRGIARVVTAVATGDLKQKFVLEAKGEVAALAETINNMIDTLSIFADQVTTVAREVGTEGKLGGQADVPGVSGTWKDLTDSVNGLAGNLTNQVRNIVLVTTAIANGDLSQKITVDAQGEILELANTINRMVDQLNTFAGEVTRVAREVGTEGILGGQAEVKGVSGTWKDLTDNVNGLAGNLTNQVRNIALVTTAIANGDLSQKITVDARGEILELANTINRMVDQLNTFAGEVTRVAREVGTEGILGGQAEVKDVSGTWKDLTDSVNGLAGNLTNQVRNIALVTTAVANGDLSQKITVDVKGEILELKNTINTMVDQLNTFAGEVTRVAREVGTEGKLGGQADVRGVSGTWKDLTDSVNFMATNLTTQVRGIARVVTAVATGDLKQKLVVDARGEVAALAETINSMTDTLSIFADQVTSVAREVGTEGKLGGQADVPGVSGTWKDLTDNVNSLASNLTNQVRNIAKVTTAIANGDLSQKITVDVKGEILELKNTINTMVDQLSSFADEVTRVAKEVGTEGKLGGQAQVRGVSGTWKDLTDNVNGLASNLTNQVRNIAKVTTAVANGDLSQKITVDAQGEILELKDTINRMVDQLNSFAAEVTRVAREVGTDGILGGQGKVPGVTGTWKDLTDSVNGLAGNLTDQVRNIAKVTTAVANGDLSQKITVDAKGEILELKNTINIMVDQLNTFANEVTRVAREVGTEGKLGGQADVRGVSGTWKDLTDNVNLLAGNLTDQVRNIAKVTTAVANGDLSQKITVDARGEISELKNTINTMVDQLSSFADEVTRVAREVGTEGVLGGQAKVPGVSGTWKDLTDNVNFMASNLTTQVRGIAKVVTAVATGDLKQKFVLEAKGEVAALAETINNMIDTLSIFADQVTTVAREVGTEGKLGGQAKVPGVSGTWKDLTDNVNFMANSLTDQVRAISDVATAVTEGDLTRLITVDAQGEVSTLKNNINQMIANLKDTTQQNQEQDWLKTNLARFSSMMQGQKTLESVTNLIMSELTPLVSSHVGAFFLNDATTGGTVGGEPVLKLIASYAYKERKNLANRFRLGEGLVGQCALEKKPILLTNVPGNYIQINSGLGESSPMQAIVLPILFEGEIMGVIELASFTMFSQIHKTFLEQLMESIGVVLNMISANMRTESLLMESQSLTQALQSQSLELQSQQDQLRRTNVELEAQANELEEKASLLAEQNEKVEIKNSEVELARTALEEKAEQLALSSKYKSEFLANMSHELRTPLNSMLILAKLLADNPDTNLSPKQVEFASTIQSSGGDLLNLINEILDLSKVEAGKMEITVTRVSMAETCTYIERIFEHDAKQKGLNFQVNLDVTAPETITTDVHRLQQVLRNLLGNAFKFTEHGSVTLNIGQATRNVILEDGSMHAGSEMISFAVIDTGIGIAREKQNLIFEAFQQADGTTSRKYGGTGLGLSISREISRLLGGRLVVESEPGVGSTFTLFLPVASRYEDEMPGLDDAASDDDDLWRGGSGGFGGGGSAQTATGYMLPPRRTPTTGRTVSGGSGLSIGLSAGRNEPVEAGTGGGGEAASTGVVDDRANIVPGDKVLLIIEDDTAFATILLSRARVEGFKGIVAQSGDDGVAFAREYGPDAISLDLRLAGMSGWNVLDVLKRDPATRHIPVQVVSVLDRNDGAAMLGAIAYLEKPVTSDALAGAFAHLKRFIERDVRELLIVEDDENQRMGLVELLSGGEGDSETDVNAIAVSTGEEALAQLRIRDFDCVVLDLTLPGMSGVEFLREIKAEPKWTDLPVIIYTGKSLTRQEEVQLKRYAASVILKEAGSADRLLDDTARFLHRLVAKMPEAKRRVVESRGASLNATLDAATAAAAASAPPAEDTASPARSRRKRTGQAGATETSASKGSGPSGGANTDLAGRTVLIVDDDFRNIFALTSMLEAHGLRVLFAESGQDGIDQLAAHPETEVVLMDIMMPGMDGYETIGRIRQGSTTNGRTLPIIALTAKAMAGDREKCLAAGATDYIPKPVDVEHLLELMRRCTVAA